MALRLFSSASPSDNEAQPQSSMEQDESDVNKYTVTWLTTKEEEEKGASISFDVYDGETLRTAALRRNVASPHNGRANLINCRGLGTCGTCAVEIVEGQVEPSERNSVEQLRFNFPPHNFHNNTKLRLACQIQVRSNVQVLKRTGFWGQKEDLVDPSVPQRYFGELEYLLDNKSPPDVNEKEE